MITFLLSVLKFTIVGVLAFIILAMGLTIAFLVIYWFISIAADKIYDYWEKKGDK